MFRVIFRRIHAMEAVYIRPLRKSRKHGMIYDDMEIKEDSA